MGGFELYYKIHNLSVCLIKDVKTANLNLIAQYQLETSHLSSGIFNKESYICGRSYSRPPIINTTLYCQIKSPVYFVTSSHLCVPVQYNKSRERAKNENKTRVKQLQSPMSYCIDQNSYLTSGQSNPFYSPVHLWGELIVKPQSNCKRIIPCTLYIKMPSQYHIKSLERSRSVYFFLCLSYYFVWHFFRSTVINVAGRVLSDIVAINERALLFQLKTKIRAFIIFYLFYWT